MERLIEKQTCKRRRSSYKDTSELSIAVSGCTRVSGEWLQIWKQNGSATKSRSLEIEGVVGLSPCGDSTMRMAGGRLGC